MKQKLQKYEWLQATGLIVTYNDCWSKICSAVITHCHKSYEWFLFCSNLCLALYFDVSILVNFCCCYFLRLLFCVRSNERIQFKQTSFSVCLEIQWIGCEEFFRQSKVLHLSPFIIFHMFSTYPNELRTQSIMCILYCVCNGLESTVSL